MSKNALYGFLFCGLSLLSSFNAKTQDVFGCDYVRELKVNKGNLMLNANNDCKNTIHFSEPFSGESKNSLDNYVMSIYFRNNEFDLSSGDSSDLKSYCRDVLKNYVESGVNAINIEAYTDCIGNEEDNLKLSDNRGVSIVNYLRKKFPDVNFYVSSFGKLKSTETRDSILLMDDRVVKIIPNENPLKRALDICKADVYLVDQSGSMKQNGEWQFLQKYNFPDSSRVYSFSKLILPPNSKLEDLNPEAYPEFFHTYDINTEIAAGKTVYYTAGYMLIPLISEDKTLTAVVNGENNYGVNSHEELINNAKNKNIRINQVGINLSEEAKRKLIEIANKTGGKYYFFRKI